jgi:hypothetical protein
MKIGIVTLALKTNYGGLLQAYALQTVLKGLGHDAVTFEYDNRLRYRGPILKYPLALLKRFIKKYVMGRGGYVFIESELNRRYRMSSQYTEKFIINNITTRKVRSLNELKEGEYDCFVVGSDQVWRPKYSFDLYNSYLKFAEKWSVTRMAYAASFGTDEWEYTDEQTKICQRLARKFSMVSVREASGIGLCRNHLGMDAVHVLDPTMLLNREDYIKLFKNSDTPESPGNMLVYILDESHEKDEYVNAVAHAKGLKPFRVNSRVENSNAPVEERIQPPVEKWLRGFYDADFVITDSFHACVFSIIFNKPFIAIGNAKRGMSRFNSLLSIFGLEDRLVTDLSVFPETTIDFDKVNERLASLRQKSFSFLKEALNG